MQHRQHQAQARPQCGGRDAHHGKTKAGENRLHDRDADHAHGHAAHGLLREREKPALGCGGDPGEQRRSQPLQTLVVGQHDAGDDGGGHELQDAEARRRHAPEHGQSGVLQLWAKLLQQCGKVGGRQLPKLIKRLSDYQPALHGLRGGGDGDITALQRGTKVAHGFCETR